MKTKVKITNNEIKQLLGSESFEFPKYSTQIINLANQNAQGTRPSIVGQMSDLIQEFSGQSIEEWEQWYLKRHPEAIQKATEKINVKIICYKKVKDEITFDLENITP